MILLPTVTLICLATRDVEASGKALEYSCRGIIFGAVKLVSPYRPENLPEYIIHEYIEPFPSIDDWNRYIVYHLTDHVQTDHCLLIHADGFVVNPHRWDPDWLLLDYIGPPWDILTSIAIQGGRNQELSRVGNSVSLRSKRLLNLPTELSMEWKRFNSCDSNEDTYISCHNWHIFAQHGCVKGTFEQAMKFGREADFPENEHIIEPFVFHRYHFRNYIYPRFNIRTFIL